jgi:hypothetical protein
MLVRILGVCPRGAQVRLSEQTNDCPFSSIKTRVARRSHHFFYLGPNVPFPVGNLLVIMLKRDALRLLTTPLHALQETPHTTQTVTYTEQPPNHMRDAVKGPIVFSITVGQGTLPECFFQLLQLSQRQTAWTMRRFQILLPLVARLQYAPSPALNTAWRHADHFRNLCCGVTLLQQHQRVRLPCGKLMGCSN